MLLQKFVGIWYDESGPSEIEVIEVAHKGKEQLLRAAIQVFSDQGFEKATTRTIAAAAGMTTGALYHHYKNKDDLFYDAVKEAAYFVHKLSRVAADSHLKAPGELLEEISWNIDQRMSKAAEQHLLILMVAYALSKGGKIKDKYRQDYREILAKVGSLFVDTFGYQNPKRQAIAASIMTAALDGIAIQYALGLVDIQDTSFREGFVAFFIQSIPNFLKEGTP